MSSEARFRERLGSAGLGKYAASLQALARSSIRLRPEPVRERDLGVGDSKLGGQPDLPQAFEWPAYEGWPQSFVAQINLRDVHPFDLDELLPPAGLVSFFYDSGQRIWGFDPAQAGGWAVHYTPEGEDIQPRDPPEDLPEEAIFGEKRLRPSAEMTYAPWEFSEVAALNLKPCELSAYAEVIAEVIGEEEGTVHRLLGHPDPVQGDMQLECQLVSHGLYCGDSTGYEDPRAIALTAGAVNWRLLFQVDSDEDARMMWGDAGRLYYWMHRTALEAWAWDETRLILQSG